MQEATEDAGRDDDAQAHGGGQRDLRARLEGRVEQDQHPAREAGEDVHVEPGLHRADLQTREAAAHEVEQVREDQRRPHHSIAVAPEAARREDAIVVVLDAMLEVEPVEVEAAVQEPGGEQEDADREHPRKNTAPRLQDGFEGCGVTGHVRRDVHAFRRSREPCSNARP